MTDEEYRDLTLRGVRRAINRHRVTTAHDPVVLVLPQVVANNLRSAGVEEIEGCGFHGDRDAAIVSFDDFRD